MTRIRSIWLCWFALLLAPWLAQAQTAGWREALMQHRVQATLPAGVQVVRDVSYGADAQQRFDVYMPAHAEQAPMILLVHGGAWSFGDKAARGVVENKVAHWVPRGFIVISTDYRMLPQTSPLVQAGGVAQALCVRAAACSAIGR